MGIRGTYWRNCDTTYFLFQYFSHINLFYKISCISSFVKYVSIAKKKYFWRLFHIYQSQLIYLFLLCSAHLKVHSVMY